MNRDDAHPDDPLAGDLDALRRALDAATFPGTAWQAPRPRHRLWLIGAAGAAAAAAAILILVAWPADKPAPTPPSKSARATRGVDLTPSAAWTTRWELPSTARLASLRKRLASRAPIAVPGPPKSVTLTGDPWTISWKAIRRRPSKQTWAERIPRIRFRGAGFSPPKPRSTDSETLDPAGDHGSKPGHGRGPDPLGAGATA